MTASAVPTVPTKAAWPRTVTSTTRASAVSVAGWVIVRCAQGSFNARNARTPATVAAIPAHSIHMSGPNARREFGIARCVDGSESGEVGGPLDHMSRGGAEPNGAAAVFGGAATVTDGAVASEAAAGWAGPDGELSRPGVLAEGAVSRSISPSRR